VQQEIRELKTLKRYESRPKYTSMWFGYSSTRGRQGIQGKYHDHYNKQLILRAIGSLLKKCEQQYCHTYCYRRRIESYMKLVGYIHRLSPDI
jgi:hypothetical protein